MKVYVIEYLASGMLGKIIRFFTQQKYSHSALFFDGRWYELDATDEYKNEPDYHFKEYMDIQQFLLTNPERERTEAFELPHEFTDGQIEKLHEWWKARMLCNINYGYGKLLTFIIQKKMEIIYRWYYRRTGKVYEPHFDLKREDVCSVAVDESLKYAGYDCFPEISERITYPGLYAAKFAEYKVIL